MMMTDGGSISIPVPSGAGGQPGGGRFDFDDGGTYCGGWQDGKAHGHGVCTGPKNVGEYSGSWNFGFEMSGVYKWTNGAVYEGRWQNGKRHGVGVEYNGKWIYKGEWSQGFKGRYGVKMSSNSAVKYEGTWANGLQDGYGCETYSNGGYYQGHMCRGLRHGYGVRKSAPYGDSNLSGGRMPASGQFSALLHHESGSTELEPDEEPKPEDGFKPTIERTLVSKNGFVLVAKPLDVPVAPGSGSPANHLSASGRAGHELAPGRPGRRGSLTGRLASSRIPGSNQLLRAFRLRRQKSAGDLDMAAGRLGRGQSPGGRATPAHPQELELPQVPFSLSPEELDITDPTTVETYTGEWKQDKRNGYGVCDRSDGLKYEGQWHNDMKCGYGATTFKDGSREEGKYKNNILVADSKVKRFFQLASSNIRQRIDEAVKLAGQAQSMALKKAEIADTRAATARDKADQASTAALEADRDSAIAYATARQFSSDQTHQTGPFGYLPGQFALQEPVAAIEPQMRHPSQPQPQHQRFGYPDYGGQQQVLPSEPVVGLEPFNGRRGSFRGHPQAGLEQPQPRPASRTASSASPSGPARPQSANDPFNDLFDHYKAAPLSPAGSTHSFPTHPRLRLLAKQTSLELSNNPSSTRATRTNSRWPKPMRMASADQQQMVGGEPDNMQQQLRHLVTSGDHHFNRQQEPFAAPSSSASSYLFGGTRAGLSPSPDQAVLSSSGQASHYSHQAEVQSLVDERQLRLAGWSPADRTEFANYDFTISSGPRTTQRCRKRTASLSRDTLVANQSAGSQASLRTRHTSAAGLADPNLQQHQHQPASIPAINILNSASRTCLESSADPATSDSTAGLAEPGSGARKTSLQVRYDPEQLGGLMSREEVAKLSHAQREQRRLQSELAEKRAQRPLLHLYLSFKDFLVHQRLILTVLMFNLFLFKMFADLIV